MAAKPIASPNNLIGQRLKLAMKKRGLSSTDLAKRADVKTSFLYDIMSGKSANPSTVTLARVADALGVGLAYLAAADDAENGSRAASNPRQAEDYISIPRVVVNISASGGTVISEEHEEERYHFRREWIEKHLGANADDLRLLYVRGDGMEPTLNHNDIIMVDTTKKKPTPPGIFVLFDGFGLVSKRLDYVPGSQQTQIRVISDNPQYSSYERSVDETFVVGRVVWFAREI